MSVRQDRDDDGVLVPCDRSSRVEDEDEDGDGDGDGEQNQALGHRERSKNSRAKHLLFLPLKKFRTLYSNSSVKEREKKTSPPTLSPLYYLEELDGGGGGGGGGKGCHLCFMDVPNNESPPSYHHLLRLAIEKNDFYSPACNPHRSPERRKP